MSGEGREGGSHTEGEEREKEDGESQEESQIDGRGEMIR